MATRYRGGLSFAPSPASLRPAKVTLTAPSDDLRPYFENPKTHPHLIRVSDELAGFAIVDDRGSDPEVDFNMAQFFVHRKFKGRGVGAHAATTCFR